MKEKTITIKTNQISQRQYSTLLLELNLIKKAWKPYGVNINMRAPGLKNVLNHGTKVHDDTKRNRRSGK